MSIIINFLEAIIATYGLCELCDIKNKKNFTIVNTTITFIIVQFFDYINQNFIPLDVASIILWMVVVCYYTQYNYFYNFFIIMIVNSICSLCATLPILFIYQYNSILAGFAAKFIQFILTYGFIKFRKRYAYLENKYWFSIMIILILCEMITNFQDELILKNTYTINNILTNIFIIIIMFISLYFFHLIEESNMEKEKITKEYEKKKYQNLTYDFMKSTKNELDRLEHKMIYQILLIKNQIDKENYDKASQIINQYIENIHKVNHTVYTGNDLLDALLTLKIKDLEYEIVLCFTITKNEFYDNVQFVNLVLDLLSSLKGKTINFFIKEESGFCVLQCIGMNMEIDQDNIKDMLKNASDLVCRYKLSKQHDINILTLKIGMITL